jgi:hypothetical protein
MIKPSDSRYSELSDIVERAYQSLTSDDPRVLTGIRSETEAITRAGREVLMGEWARAEASRDVSAGLNLLLADMFALYMKTKNFHWPVSGPQFRDYHLLLDEQADLYAATVRSLNR